MSGNVYEVTGTTWQDPSSEVGRQHDAGFAKEFQERDFITTRGGAYLLRQLYVCTSFRTAGGVGFHENRERIAMEGFRLVQTMTGEPEL